MTSLHLTLMLPACAIHATGARGQALSLTTLLNWLLHRRQATYCIALCVLAESDTGRDINLNQSQPRWDGGDSWLMVVEPVPTAVSLTGYQMGTIRYAMLTTLRQSRGF